MGIGTKLTIIKPANNSTVSNNFALWYTASSKAPIASVEVIVNGTSAGTYQYNKPTINDTKTITIPDAAVGTTHTVQVIVTDGV